MKYEIRVRVEVSIGGKYALVWRKFLLPFPPFIGLQLNPAHGDPINEMITISEVEWCEQHGVTLAFSLPINLDDMDVKESDFADFGWMVNDENGMYSPSGEGK